MISQGQVHHGFIILRAPLSTLNCLESMHLHLHLATKGKHDLCIFCTLLSEYLMLHLVSLKKRVLVVLPLEIWVLSHAAKNINDAYMSLYEH